MVSSIVPKKRTKVIILSEEDTQDSEFRSFFRRIEDPINCIRDLLTFSEKNMLSKKYFKKFMTLTLIKLMIRH